MKGTEAIRFIQCGRGIVERDVEYIKSMTRDFGGLASHALGLTIKRIAGDWEELWGYRPFLLKTFVGEDYAGTCYKAAGFQYLGMTTGQGLVRQGESYTTQPRKIFVKPLSRDFRFLLCSEQLKGREQQ